jgi:hypothetical protein
MIETIETADYIKYKCENCTKFFLIGSGIIAEIQHNKISSESCDSFTKLTALCSSCVSKLKIEL